ncbi:MAG: hypothetical protein ACLU38_01370 [Dysosmobacter sp.]
MMQGNDVLQGTPDVMVCDSLRPGQRAHHQDATAPSPPAAGFRVHRLRLWPRHRPETMQYKLSLASSHPCLRRPLIASAPCRTLLTSWCGAVCERSPRRGVCAGRQGRAGGAPAPEAGGFRSGG